MRKTIYQGGILSVAAVAMAALSSPHHADAQTMERLTNKAKELVAPIAGKTDDRLQEVAKFDHQVTGVTVSEDGRIFVNFPRWSEDVPVSVAEVMTDGSIKPYPNNEWNAWRNEKMSEISPKDHFVTVQSVVADGRGSLWVVDPAAPNSEKTVKDGPKLVQVDLKTNSVKRVYPFGPDIAGPASYLNDVRIAPDGAFAYFTDSGMPGGLVVLDLNSGRLGASSVTIRPRSSKKTSSSKSMANRFVGLTDGNRCSMRTASHFRRMARRFTGKP